MGGGGGQSFSVAGVGGIKGSFQTMGVGLRHTGHLLHGESLGQRKGSIPVRVVFKKKLRSPGKNRIRVFCGIKKNRKRSAPEAQIRNPKIRLPNPEGADSKENEDTTKKKKTKIVGGGGGRPRWVGKEVFPRNNAGSSWGTK